MRKRTPKETATVVHHIITQVNKRYKQNRNKFKGKQALKGKQVSLFEEPLSDEAKLANKIAEKEAKEKEAEELRKRLREFKKERKGYIEKLCRKYGVSTTHIIRVGGFNDYSYL